MSPLDKVTHSLQITDKLLPVLFKGLTLQEWEQYAEELTQNQLIEDYCDQDREY